MSAGRRKQVSSWRRALTAVALLPCALLVGCGSSTHGSGHTSTSTTAASTSAGAEVPSLPLPPGARNLDVRLAAQITRQQRGLSKVKLSCPATSKLPTTCAMTATQAGLAISTSAAAKNKTAAELKRPHPVAGTVKVYDVNARTGVYDYDLQYALKR